MSSDETIQKAADDFGDPRAEYAAARETAAFFDLSRRAQIEVTGADRAKFLHNFCTNNIKALQAHQGCEAFCTNVKGRVIGYICVFCTEQSLWIETVEDAEEGLLAHLDRYIITEDVQLHSRTSAYRELLVSGPKSIERLAQTGLNVHTLELYEHSMVHLNGGKLVVVIRRVDWLQQPGYLVSVSRAQLSELSALLTASGVQPAGTTAFEVLRIEAAFPLFGIDITDENLAQEVARTPLAISFTKGCYLGQEPIARIDAMGHVNRELRGLQIEPGPLPASGAKVISAKDEKEIGTITSSARLAEGEPAVALAYLRSNSLTPGTPVIVHAGEAKSAATVAAAGNGRAS